ncbi:unknown [Spodoptera litura nucleopolyhedrovirus II]|uniref:hypothetical protein n=1 Tax=Spodoptera litura nucleopolyhedrovirus II TaxID=566270 RepID=UPI0001874607|nr:hypothetical protein SlnV2_gp107 [Spodoptera litura nucleopolyhedrovirus II]ACI47475.1 unknown [Spodoptera litura nucleopolyhedrovirus II]
MRLCAVSSKLVFSLVVDRLVVPLPHHIVRSAPAHIRLVLFLLIVKRRQTFAAVLHQFVIDRVVDDFFEFEV